MAKNSGGDHPPEEEASAIKQGYVSTPGRLSIVAIVALALFSVGGCLAARHEGQLGAAVIGTVFAAAFLAVAVLGSMLGTSSPPQSKRPADSDFQKAVGGISELERIQIVMTEWKSIVDVQMHFNEMIIRMRTLAISVVISVFGAAGFAIANFRNQFVTIYGHQAHVAVLIIAFGLVLWLTIFIIDYWYYYKLLMGAVYRGNDIDDAFSGIDFVGHLKLFGSARRISAAIGPPGFSTPVIVLFYGVVYFTGLAYLIAVLIVINPLLPIPNLVSAWAS